MQISSIYSKFARLYVKPMLLIKNKVLLNTHLSSLGKKSNLGLVPTMGALHIGHAALVKRAVLENDLVVVSIFVNPTQFNNKEDLEKYPKTLKADIALLKGISKDIIVFAPSATEMYHNDIKSRSYDFGNLEHVMEGAFREGHFDGVGTIVEALLNTVKPNTAYFGEKDYQQLQIIRKLVSSKAIPVTIVGCPIVREANGLAYSSRNKQLATSSRSQAAIIYKTLKTAKRLFGTKSAKSIKEWVHKEFENVTDFKMEYIEISDAQTLKPLIRKQKNKKYRAFIAVYVDGVRLIDNIALN